MARCVTVLAGLSLLALGMAWSASERSAEAQGAPEIKRKALLKEDATIPNYQVIMNVVEIPAGVREIRHTHPGPLAGYILEGTLILEHEGRPAATYRAGDAFLIEAGKVHQGINTANGPVKILATLVVEKDKPASAPAP